MSVRTLRTSSLSCCNRPTTMSSAPSVASSISTRSTRSVASPTTPRSLATSRHGERGGLQFVGNVVADRRMGRLADGFVPPERDELDDVDQSQWEVKDGELRDPWTLQFLLPFEDP